MPFDPSQITAISKPLVQGRELYISWTSSAPPGTPFQLYLNGQLAWAGTRTWCRVPLPSGGESPLRAVLGTVLPQEISTDFSPSLPPSPDRRALLSWDGGTFEDPDIAGFNIYGSSAPGGAVNYTSAIGSVAAYPGGIVTDGWGLGGWGAGAWGSAPNTYTWKSGALASGTWTFAVVPYDTSGNEGAPQTAQVTITAPPTEPPVFPGSSDRLRCAIVGWGNVPWGAGGWGEPEVRLNWLPSTG